MPTDPGATAVPKWHDATHLSEIERIFAAGPIWNVPFHARAITGGTLMTEMRQPQKGSQKAVESSGGIVEYGIYIGGAATVRFRAGIEEGKKMVEMRGIEPLTSALRTRRSPN
jgi:hypothetical protein